MADVTVRNTTRHGTMIRDRRRVDGRTALQGQRRCGVNRCDRHARADRPPKRERKKKKTAPGHPDKDAQPTRDEQGPRSVHFTSRCPPSALNASKIPMQRRDTSAVTDTTIQLRLRGCAMTCSVATVAPSYAIQNGLLVSYIATTATTDRQCQSYPRFF